MLVAATVFLHQRPLFSSIGISKLLQALFIHNRSPGMAGTSPAPVAGTAEGLAYVPPPTSLTPLTGVFCTSLPHDYSFNVSVDQANYVSLRAFLGTLPVSGGKLSDLIRDEDDGDLPSVEAYLDTLSKGIRDNLAQGLRGKRAAAVEVGAEGGQKQGSGNQPPSHPYQRKLNVYAKDQRSNFDWDVYPDRVVGKLMFPASYYCTGQLIGKRLVAGGILVCGFFFLPPTLPPTLPQSLNS